MIFNTAFSPAEVVPTNPGTTHEVSYHLVNDHGDLEPDAIPVDVQALIQSQEQEASFTNILKRFECGDTSALKLCDLKGDDVKDFSNIPTSLMDAENQMIKAREYFDRLPLEVRSSYGFDNSRFLQAVVDGSFQEKYIKPEVDKRVNAKKAALEKAKLDEQNLFSRFKKFLTEEVK